MYMKRPWNFQAYKNLGTEKSSSDGYIILLVGFARSPCRDFEIFHRNVVGLDEDDIELIINKKICTLSVLN